MRKQILSFLLLLPLAGLWGGKGHAEDLVVKFVASGTAHKGNPEIGLIIDNRIVSAGPITASYANDDWDEVTFEIPTSSAQVIGVGFLNGGDTTSNGRELHVQYASINGVKIQPEDGIFQAAIDDQSKIGDSALKQRGYLLWKTDIIAKKITEKVALETKALSSQQAVQGIDPGTASPGDAATSNPSSSGSNGGSSSGGGGGSTNSGGASSSDGASASGGSAGAIAPAAVATPATISNSGSSSASQTNPMDFIPTIAQASEFANLTINPLSPAQALPQDWSQQISLPDGRIANVVVKAPNNPSGPVITLPPLVGGADAYTYFQNAISQAIAKKASMLVIPKATYIINAPAGGVNLEFNHLSDCIIEGNGSTFVFTNANTVGIHFPNNQRILARNFNYTWHLATVGDMFVAHGVVTGGKLVLDNGTIINANTPAIKNVILFDNKAKKWVQGNKGTPYASFSTPPTYVGNNTFTSPQFSQAPFSEGASVLARFHVTDGHGIVAIGRNTQDISLENVTAYAVSGMAYIFEQMGRGMRMYNCKLMLDPLDPSQLISATADGIHIDQTRGDIILENNYISSQADDGLNINGGFGVTSAIQNAAPDGTQTVSFGATFDISPFVNAGDHFVFFDSNLKYIGATTIAGIVSSDANGVTLKLNQAIAGLEPSFLAADVDAGSTRFYVSGNTFYNNRGNGILAQSANGLLTNNVITSPTNDGIRLITNVGDPRWHEGFGPSNVLVSNNQISGTGWSQIGGGIIFADYVPSGLAQYPGNIQNVNIIGNSFNSTAGPAIFVSSAINVFLLGNTVTNSNTDTTDKAQYGTADTNASILISDSQAIALKGNTLSGSSDPIKIDSNSAENIVYY